MSGFTKNKITFVVALLATLFTITPIITTIGLWGYDVPAPLDKNSRGGMVKH